MNSALLVYRQFGDFTNRDPSRRIPKNYIMKTKSKFSKIILLFFLLLFTGNLWSQEFSITISSGGSDYSMTATYDSDGPCQCNDDYIFSVYRNNFLPSNFMASKSGSSNTGSVSFNVGPKQTNSYIMNMLIKGSNKFILNCVADCEGSGSITKSASTASLKRPSSGSTSDGSDFITLKWKRVPMYPNPI
jgi:hypothetical protein